MKILIDTNIILDVLLEREPFLGDAAKIINKAEQKELDGYVTANSVTDVVYVVRKKYSVEEIKSSMLNMLKIIKVISIDGSDIIKAFRSEFKDLEDALQSQCADKENIDYIITRNKKDFTNSKVPAISTENLITLL